MSSTPAVASAELVIGSSLERHVLQREIRGRSNFSEAPHRRGAAACPRLAASEEPQNAARRRAPSHKTLVVCVCVCVSVCKRWLVGGLELENMPEKRRLFSGLTSRRRSLVRRMREGKWRVKSL